MAADEVAAETVGQAQGLFQIDFARGVEPRCAVERFARDVDLVLAAGYFDDCQADAVVGDGVSKGDIGQVEAGGVDGQAKALFERMKMRDFAKGSNDACKHGG